MNNNFKNSYFFAISWFVLHSISSVMNDVISKYTGLNLSSFEVAFFRFLFGAITILPFAFYKKAGTLKTTNFSIHILRGALLLIGIVSWTYGLTTSLVTTATVISFSIPVFTLILAVFFLKENIIWQRWFVTLIAFIGIIITLKPHSNNFNPKVLVFILAALSFAMLDIINKKFIIKESMISMLFYSSFFTSIFSAPLALYYWQTPSTNELFLLFLLGASSNLILFFILKAFSLADATALAPYRYLELLISSIASFLVFSEIPDKSTIYGALVIIPSTLFIIYSENKNSTS